MTGSAVRTPRKNDEPWWWNDHGWGEWREVGPHEWRGGIYVGRRRWCGRCGAAEYDPPIPVADPA